MAISDDCWVEVRTGGNDDNGGGFIQGASGTDYSQQTTAQLTLTDLATSGTTVTTLTSATGGFTSAMVGNIIQLTAGTNLTTGFYQITAYTDTNTVTLDRAPDNGVGGVSGATGRVGGCLASLGAAARLLATNGASTWKGNRVYAASGTYTLTTASSATNGGPMTGVGSSTMVDWIGYNTTRGDLDGHHDMSNNPYIDAGAVTGVTFIDNTSCGAGDNDNGTIRNFTFDGNDNTTTNGGNCLDASHSYLRATQMSTDGFGSNNQTASIFVNCVADNCGNIGFHDVTTVNCVAHDNGSHGFFSDTGTRHVRGLSYDNAGRGFSNDDEQAHCIDCTADGNTSDGFYGVRTSSFTRCLSTNNGGYGFNGNNDYIVLSCKTYNNTSGSYDTADDVPGVYNIENLSGDPYTNRAGKDFSVTSGSGLASFHGLYGQDVGYDFGAVQSLASASTEPKLIRRKYFLPGVV